MPILPFEVCSLFASLNQKWVADIQPAMGTLVRCYLTKDGKTRLSHHINFFSLFVLLRQYTPDHPEQGQEQQNDETNYLKKTALLLTTKLIKYLRHIY